MNTIDRLNLLYELKRDAASLALEKQNEIDAVYTPEIKAQISEISNTFIEKTQLINNQITQIEAEIKLDILILGKSLDGNHFKAIYLKGRTSWDTAALDGYAAAYPEVLQFKHQGPPSVSIRVIQKS